MGFFVAMVYVYVLKSLKSDIYYIGIAIDVQIRLKEHNAGKSKFTKGHLPWKLLRVEEEIDWTAARAREKYLKSAAGKRYLKKLLSEGSLPD
jgi:putative endonuclease